MMSSSVSQTDIYETLDKATRDIRLMRLGPKSPGDVFSCELFKASLDENLAYKVCN